MTRVQTSLLFQKINKANNISISPRSLCRPRNEVVKKVNRVFRPDTILASKMEDQQKCFFLEFRSFMNVMHYPLLNNEDFNPFVFRKTNILKQLIKAWCTLSQNFPKLIDNSTKCLNFQPQLHFMVLKKFSIQHTIKVSESEYFRIRLSKFSRLCKTLFNILKNCM